MVDGGRPRGGGRPPGRLHGGPRLRASRRARAARLQGAGRLEGRRAGDGALREAWWEPFGDETLNGLERQADVSSQTVLIAEAQLRQARALVQEARSQLFPTVTV